MINQEYPTKKDIEMCMIESNLSNGKVIQLIRDFTSDHARNTVDVYLDIIPVS